MRKKIPVVFVFFVALATARLGFAQPFEKAYEPRLDHLAIDGDLRLSIPIHRWKCTEGQIIPIYLEHRLQNLDYGECSSVFTLRPFTSGVVRLSPTELVWRSPGGAEKHLKSAGAVRTALPADVSALLPASFGDGSEVLYFDEPGFRFFADPLGRWHVALDHGWAIAYVGGRMHAFTTPDATRFDVETHGSGVRSVSSAGRELVTLQWNPDGTPALLRIDGEVYHFKNEADGKIAGVKTTSGKIVAELSYDEKNLLTRCRLDPGNPVIFRWRPVSDYRRGDSLFVLPYVLAGAGSVTYSLSRNDSTALLSSIDESGSRSILFRFRNGRIRSIRESSKLP